MRFYGRNKVPFGWWLFFILFILSACGDKASSTPGTATLRTNSTGTVTITNSNPPSLTATPAPASSAGSTVTLAAVASATGAGTTVSTSQTGLTMKEAFNLAAPTIKAWQPDQFLFAIFNSLDSGIGISPDGRSLEWNFQAISPKLNKRATWLVKTARGSGTKPEVSKTGDEELNPDEVKFLMPLPAVNTLIDSNQLLEIARQNGGESSDSPVGFFLRQPVKEGEPLAVDLVFYKGKNVVSLRIDMQSGRVVPNVKG